MRQEIDPAKVSRLSRRELLKLSMMTGAATLLGTRAASEKERLAADGFKLTVRRVDVSIPTKNLTAGSFAEKSAAEGVLKKLRAAGVKATLTRQ